MSRARSTLAAVALLSGLTALPIAVALAAQPDAAARFDALALDWARGRWATPVVCEIAGEPKRGIRRLMILPGPRRMMPPVDVLRFVPMEAKTASRCFDDLGRQALEIEGALQIRPPRRSRIDGPREFEQALERERGIEFRVVAGMLRLSEVGAEASSPREVDVAGSELWLRAVPPGSDDARLLADFRSPRKLQLELRGPDDLVLRLPLFLTAPR